MPSSITHYLFALRAISRLKRAGMEIDRDMALIGAQGPDILFFHRAFPWQRGTSHAFEGSTLHRMSPARLFEAMRSMVNDEKHDRLAIISYIQGFFCHYALDRAAHPYVLWAQEKLKSDDPAYGFGDRQYHFRIESALDTIILRKETGRLIKSFDLMTVMPANNNNSYQKVGGLYQDLLSRLFCVHESSENLALAPADMRHAMFFMNDRALLRQRLLINPVEKLLKRGHFASSLMRPSYTGDWDYANEAHEQWYNPFDKRLVSNDNFFDIYNFALNEVTDMINAFVKSLPSGKSMLEITQDRGFSSDLPGVY